MAESQADPLSLFRAGETRGKYFAHGASKTMYVLTDTAMLSKIPSANVLAFEYFCPVGGMTEHRLSRILYEIGPLNKEFAPITAEIYGGFKLDVGPTYFMKRDDLIKSFSANQKLPGTPARNNIMAGVLNTLFIIEKLDCFEAVVTTYDELYALVDTIIDMGYCWTDIKIENICKGRDSKLKIIDLDPEFLFKLDVVVAKTGKDYATISKILKNYMIRQLYSTVKEKNIEGHGKQPEMLSKDLNEMLGFIKTRNKIFVEAILKMQPSRSVMSGDDIDRINKRTPYAMYTMYTAPAQDHKRSRSQCGQSCSSVEKSSRQPDTKKPNTLPQVATPWFQQSCTISGGRIKKRRSTHKKKMKKKPSKKYRSRRHKYTKRR